MKVTTSRRFRQQHLNDYTVDDFDNFSDYFFYLHLNHRTQFIHTVGCVFPLLFLPWSLKKMLKERKPLALTTVSALFYGAGFVSHWSEDGLVSKTVQNFGPAYKEVLLLNWRFMTRTLAKHEQAFIKKYPHVLWVYDASRSK